MSNNNDVKRNSVYDCMHEESLCGGAENLLVNEDHSNSDKIVEPDRVPIFAMDPILQLYRLTTYLRRQQAAISKRTSLLKKVPKEKETKVKENRSGYEPEWAAHVGEKGDLLYIEPPEAEESRKLDANNAGNHINNNHIKDHQVKLPVKLPKERKAIKKLRGLMGIKKGSGATSSSKTESKANHKIGTHPRTVTFQDSATGFIKTVHLFVDPSKHNYGRRASLCETIFGIVPGHFNMKPTLIEGEVRNGGPISEDDTRIMIHGLLPEGVASRSGELKIGDWLKAINDTNVNFKNIDAVLANIQEPSQVKVTLQKLAVESYEPSSVVQRQPVNENLVKLVSGDRMPDVDDLLQDIPHVAMYLTLDCSSDNMKDKDDVLYQYPKQDSKLVQVRGMFITLCHMLLDVTNNTAKNSTVTVDDQLVHIGYAKEGRQLLVVGLPANNVSREHLNHIMEDIVRLMKVLHSSLGSAFSPVVNHDRLDHFFSLLFQRYLLPDDIVRKKLKSIELQQEPFLDSLLGVRAMNLPEDVKVMVNTTLSEYEAADFADMSDDYYDMRRSYTILGTTLYYKGYLVANHLHKEDMLDINLYLKHYCLLALSAEGPIGQVVVWKEVFPTRRCHCATDPLIPGYTEPDARWYLLIVGLKHSMLCVLLEAGGCSTWAEGHPTPDPFYVDQAKATLLQLESQEFCIHCEQRLHSAMLPGIVSVDRCFHQPKKSKDEPPSPLVPGSPIGVSSSGKRIYAPESILKKRPSPGVDRRDMGSEDGSSPSVPSDLSSPRSTQTLRKTSTDQQSETSSESGSANMFKSNKKTRNVPGPFDMSDMKRKLHDVKPDKSVIKITSGLSNSLFHYVHFDSMDGIYICPSTTENQSIDGATHKLVVQNFYDCCLTIRKLFQETINAQKHDGPPSKFGEDTSFNNVTEHGVLFQCTPAQWRDTKKQPPVLTYWVVGRLQLDPCPRECFVCFHDSIHQNLIEMAFKLSFGISV